MLEGAWLMFRLQIDYICWRTHVDPEAIRCNYSHIKGTLSRRRTGVVAARKWDRSKHFLFHMEENCVSHLEVSQSNMGSLLRSPGWSLRKERRSWIISRQCVLFTPSSSFQVQNLFQATRCRF